MAGVVFGQEPVPDITASSLLPVYLSLAPNLNAFDHFANGGPDANWYVGFNNAWIVRLPPMPPGSFARAYIGAKLGRAKTNPDPNKPWQRKKIEGEVSIAVSQSPAFSADQSYFLAELADIPTEADPESYVQSLGASQWFWAEVPLSQISSTEPNYLIVWSPTDYLLSDSNAPILAGATAESADSSVSNAGNNEANAWNNHSITGVAPRKAAGTLETSLSNLYPALAIKLVPENGYRVSVENWEMTQQPAGALIRFSALGQNITHAWLESSQDQIHWARRGPEEQNPPFMFFIPLNEEVKGFYVRGAAEDEWGNQGNSPGESLTP